MAKIKTLPKILIIAAIVGAVGFAGNHFYDGYKAKHANDVTAQPVDVGTQLPSPDPVTPQQNATNQKFEQIDQENHITPAVPTPRQMQAQSQASASTPASSGADHSFDAMKDMGKMK